jgi:hypothetical protein
LQQLYRSDLKGLQYFEALQVRALLTSQSKQDIDKKSVIKSHFLKTPILNTWQQPMHIKRAINNVRRWYAETMTLLLPALPSEEWDRIEVMSKRQQRIGFVRPRKPTVEIEALPASDDSSPERMLRHNLAMDKLSKAD